MKKFRKLGEDPDFGCFMVIVIFFAFCVLAASLLAGLIFIIFK